MNRLVIVVTLLACVAAGQAQNRLPLDEAQRYAKACVEHAAKLGDGPFKIDVDADKPCAERGEAGGAMAVPDKKLTAAAIAKADKTIVPVAQLYLRKWTLVKNGKPLGKDDIRGVVVNVDDKDRPMPLFLLGVRKNDKGKLELLACANDVDSAIVVPLTDYGSNPTVPVELEWKRGENNIDTLTLNIAGKYQAVLPVTRQ